MTLHDRTPGPDEHALLAAAQAGDEHAFGSLTRCHRGRLGLYCLLMLGSPQQAFAALHEVMLRGWSERDGIAAPASVRIWLYRLATEVCLENLVETDESEPRPPFHPSNDDD